MLFWFLLERSGDGWIDVMADGWRESTPPPATNNPIIIHHLTHHSAPVFAACATPAPMPPALPVRSRNRRGAAPAALRSASGGPWLGDRWLLDCVVDVLWWVGGQKGGRDKALG